MENISSYKDSPDPLLRATYWLTEYSWNNKVEFERLQVLASQTEQLSALLKIQADRETELVNQNAEMLEALKEAKKYLSGLYCIDEAIAKAEGEKRE
jgi:hypothetical protein